MSKSAVSTGARSNSKVMGLSGKTVISQRRTVDTARLPQKSQSQNTLLLLTSLFFMQLPGADAGKPDVKGAAEKAIKKSPLGFMNVGDLAFELNLPGSSVKKSDLPNGPKPFGAGEVNIPSLPSTDDLPSLPGNPADQVTCM